jgi:hypothetical protein
MNIEMKKKRGEKMKKKSRWLHEPCGTTYEACPNKIEHMAYFRYAIEQELKEANQGLRNSIFRNLICMKCKSRPKWYDGGVEGKFISCKCYSKEFPGAHKYVLWGYVDPPKEWTGGKKMKVNMKQWLE